VATWSAVDSLEAATDWERIHPMNAGCKGVGTGLVRGLSDGLNSRMVRVMVFQGGWWGSNLLFLLLLPDGLCCDFPQSMEEKILNFLNCFETLNPVNGCNSRLIRLLNFVLTPLSPVLHPVSVGRFWGISAESESE